MAKTTSKKRGVKGGGSLSYRKDGRWMGRYSILLPNGKRTTKAVYGKTKEETRKLLAQKIARRDRGELVNNCGMTVEKFYNIWMEEFVGEYLKDTTIELYKRVFNLYVIPIIGKKNLATLNLRDVQKCASYTKKNSIHQARIVKKGLSSMLEKAKKSNYIFTNPARDVELKNQKDDEGDNEEEDGLVLWSVEELKKFLNEAKNSSKYYAAYVLAAVYGMRRGEVLGLCWKDVDLDNNQLHIRRQVVNLNNQPHLSSLKTKKSKRTLEISPEVKNVLVELAKDTPSKRQDLLFRTKNGTPIAPRNFYRDFQRVSKKANLPHIKIHTLRHMAACFMRDEGVDMKTCQEIMGHATIDMTLKIYQHSSTEHKATASRKVATLMLG